MTGSKREKIQMRYLEMTNAKWKKRRSHDQAVKLLQDIFCEPKNEIEKIVEGCKDCSLQESPKEEPKQKPKETPKKEVPKLTAPDEVINVLMDAITDLTAQHDAYFKAFNRVDDTLKELEQKIDILSTYLAVVGGL